jgi:hypothetical protein
MSFLIYTFVVYLTRRSVALIVPSVYSHWILTHCTEDLEINPMAGAPSYLPGGFAASLHIFLQSFAILFTHMLVAITSGSDSLFGLVEIRVWRGTQQ